MRRRCRRVPALGSSFAGEATAQSIIRLFNPDGEDRPERKRTNLDRLARELDSDFESVRAGVLTLLDEGDFLTTIDVEDAAPHQMFELVVDSVRLAAKSPRCVHGHVFDIAREGYANLLQPQHRRSRDPGYSREMIAGRRDFFDAGHYQALADGIADVIVSYLPGSAERVVVDAGCGEGYYLRRLRARMVEHRQEVPTVLCGIDISKHAIRVAAKRDPRGLYAVAGTYRMPVLPNRSMCCSPISPR